MPRKRRLEEAPEFMRLPELVKALASQGRTEKTQNAYRRWLADFGVWILETEGEAARPTEPLAQEFLAHLATVKHYSPATLYNVRQALSYWSVLFDEPGWFRADIKPPRPKDELTPDLVAFARWLKEHGKAEKTIRSYVQRVRLFQEWWMQCPEGQGRQFSPSDWTPWDLTTYTAQLKGTAKPATVNLAIASLSQYGTWAVEGGHIQRNPIQNAGQLMVPGEVGTPKWLGATDDGRLARELHRRTQSDYRRAPWKRAMAVRDWALYLLMRDAGLRVSEVTRLTTDHVDLKEKNVVVRFSKWNRSRVVPMSRRLRDGLEMWLQVRGDVPSPYLFLSQHHTQLAERTIQGRAADWKRWCDLPAWFTAHSLRHTFGKALALEGHDPAKIALLMGHLKKDGKPNLDMVAVYTTPSQVELREAIEKSGR